MAALQAFRLEPRITDFKVYTETLNLPQNKYGFRVKMQSDIANLWQRISLPPNLLPT